MAHLDARIAQLQEELAQLQAERAAEAAALAVARPAGIPPDWVPITFKRGPVDFIIVAWVDPAFTANVFPVVRRAAQPVTGAGH